MTAIFITGIGTEVGKTVTAAIVTEALQAAYWKPVQAGFDNGTDSEWVAERISHPQERIIPETYKLALPASPHIAARKEDRTIDLEQIVADFQRIMHTGSVHDFLVIEGAGGLFVPLNDNEFVIDLIQKLGVSVILVSRNYLGSINHSLLTAAACKSRRIPVAGWVFNDHYMDYEEEIVRWTGIPSIGSIPRSSGPDMEFIQSQAQMLRPALLRAVGPSTDPSARR